MSVIVACGRASMDSYIFRASLCDEHRFCVLVYGHSTPIGTIYGLAPLLYPGPKEINTDWH
jgi:hypothetical protein